jgi:tetratricopeptide (TPR) repeat protein
LRYSQGYPELSGCDAERCVELANKAIERAGDDAAVLAHCGIALQLVAREYERGLAVAERGAALNPNDPVALGFAGLAQYLGGSLEVALERLRYCIALQPSEGFEAMGTIANVYAALGRHGDALEWAGRGLAINPNYQPCLWVTVGSAFHLGRREEARKALDHLLSRHPSLTVEGLKRVRPKDESRDEPMAEAMLAVGMPPA